MRESRREADAGMIVGTSHESARSDFRRVLNGTTPAAIEPGHIFAYGRVVDPRAETIDLANDLRHVGCII